VGAVAVFTSGAAVRLWGQRLKIAVKANSSRIGPNTFFSSTDIFSFIGRGKFTSLEDIAANSVAGSMGQTGPLPQGIIFQEDSIVVG
jgi:hypothetical protein